MNQRYHAKLKTQHLNIFVLLLKVTNNNAENLKCVKHVNTSIVCQQFGISLASTETYFRDVDFF